MIPVYLSKVFAYVVKQPFLVVPHFSNLDILSENLSETLKVKSSELNFINVNSDLIVKEKVEIGSNEIFIDERLFDEIKRLEQDSFVYSDKYYQNLIQNLEIAGPASFLTINDRKLLYELGYSYFSNLFKQKSLQGSIYLTGLSNFAFTSEMLLSLISDSYSGEGLVKVYKSSLMGQHMKDAEKLIGSIFFGSGKIVVGVDFGLDEDHKINITKADKVQINLGKNLTQVNIKTLSKGYKFLAEEGEVGFFIDTRDKPVKSINLLKSKVLVKK
ncbi:MAG: hypothetical protein O2871_02480 [bacterium]|nr:hypothetical protein [bacterium]